MLRALVLVSAISSTLVACEAGPTPTAHAGPDPAASAAAVAPATTAAVAPASAAAPKSDRVQLVAAGEGPVAPLVAAEVAKARADGRALLVYVGATWCEPCERFHRAAERGELDPTLPPMRLLVFDLDRDEARLKAAGYGTQYVPLFVVPDAEGRGTTHRISGSIKGPGAVDEITPRLRALAANLR